MSERDIGFEDHVVHVAPVTGLIRLSLCHICGVFVGDRVAHAEFHEVNQWTPQPDPV
jgi:hypothetical protein